MHFGGAIQTQNYPRKYIDIEPSVSQLIAIPTIYGTYSSATSSLINNGNIAKIGEYVVDQLEHKYGSGCVEVANTFYGDVNAFRSFVPSSTPRNNVNNFELAYLEEDNTYEPVGFWLKSNLTSAMRLEYVEFR